MKPLHLLYISGFGDRYDPARRVLLGRWRFEGVTVELVPMNWTNKGESFETKMARINKAIDAHGDKRVVVMGESAGGSMAVHICASRGADVYRVVTLCGKNTTPQTVSPHLYGKYPAFKTSMDKLEDSLEKIQPDVRRQFISVHPVYDSIVPVGETLLPGCRELILPGKGHLTVIFRALTLWSGRIVRALNEGL